MFAPFFVLCLMLRAAPLAGGGGASVIINVSSDTQIQVWTTILFTIQTANLL
jgi:hypothetical protein